MRRKKAARLLTGLAYLAVVAAVVALGISVAGRVLLGEAPRELPESLAIAVLTAAVLYLADKGLRANGARNQVRAGAAVTGLVFVLASIAQQLLIGAGFVWWLLIAIEILAVVVLLISWLRPDFAVRVGGGPRSEWGLLRARAHLYVKIEEMSNEEARLRDGEIRNAVADLERYRTETTSEYIDLVRKLLVDPPTDWGPAEFADARRRFADLERSMRDGLGIEPVWERDIEQRILALSSARTLGRGGHTNFQ